MFAGKVESNHPFGKELEQVNELAEEFGVSDVAVFDEEEDLVSHGLMKFGAEDYVTEIQGLFGEFSKTNCSPVGSRLDLDIDGLDIGAGLLAPWFFYPGDVQSFTLLPLFLSILFLLVHLQLPRQSTGLQVAAVLLR
jgi:hypothetical protein